MLMPQLPLCFDLSNLLRPWRQQSRGLRAVFVAIAVTAAVGTPLADAAEEPADAEYSHWPEDLKISGRILVYRDLEDLSGLEGLLPRLAAGRTVLALINPDDTSPSALERTLAKAVGKEGRYAEVSRSEAGAELAIEIAGADAVLLDDDFDTLPALEKPLRELVERGGTILADAAAARRFGRYSLSSGAGAELEDGLNLLPDCVLASVRSGDDLINALEQRPRTVGLRLEENAAFVLSVRKVFALGPGEVTVCLAKGTAAEPAFASISAAARRSRRNPETQLFDLTQWRRRAIDRALPPFPEENPPPPIVENGTLLIVGGGGSPRGLMDRFIELAGGVENAKLVYIPCSENESVGERHGIVSAWKRMGVKNAAYIHTKDRRKADQDEEFLAPLRDATGLFFGGGRQWNFSDSYYGTTAH
ncbi:MAG: hypothetical protein AAF907_04800, partial [Planctomycetota bacterium]